MNKIDKINQVILDRIIDNMDAFVETDKYDSINTTYKTTTGYNLIKFISETYTLQEETTCNGQISPAGDLFVKYQNMKYMQDNRNWYSEQSSQQKNMNLPTPTIVHPCLDFTTVTNV